MISNVSKKKMLVLNCIYFGLNITDNSLFTYL